MNTLKTLIATYLRLNQTKQKLESDFIATHNETLTAFVEELIVLKEEFSSERSKLLFELYMELPLDVQEGLLNSRRYNGNQYIPLSHFVNIKNGHFSLTKSCTTEILTLFKEAENAMIHLKPAKNTKKCDRAQAAHLVVKSTPECQYGNSDVDELLPSQKKLKRVKTNLTTLINLANESNLVDILTDLQAIEKRMLDHYEKMASDDLELQRIEFKVVNS